MSIDDVTLALAQARELEQRLREIAERPEHGDGSCVALAAEAMDSVIGYLEPDADDDEAPPRPRLRLVGR
jgi:hypothetical protein